MCKGLPGASHNGAYHSFSPALTTFLRCKDGNSIALWRGVVQDPASPSGSDLVATSNARAQNFLAHVHGTAGTGAGTTPSGVRVSGRTRSGRVSDYLATLWGPFGSETPEWNSDIGTFPGSLEVLTALLGPKGLNAIALWQQKHPMSALVKWLC